MILRLLLFLIAFPLLSHAQPAETNPDAAGHAAIRKHYPETELNEIAAQNPAKMEAIRYYYTRSFILEPLKCEECAHFDIAHFDVSKYEHLRKKDSRFVKEDPKYGFRITLLSTDELEHKLTIHAPQIPAENED
ncbi:MAG: hypothetical protein K0R65_1793 [Crocinitomicaceae bacterium]|nr:hypothetical protein [Crocinitomicaceae bacterium]